ncbi:MAG: SpoIIE family protein phosphatase [Acidimicrobiales bacterium]
MLIVWGPHYVEIYNDGYSRMLGPGKHPRALGTPAAEVWPEVWDQVGALFDSVTTSGQPTWAEDQLFVIERDGFAEECYFTFSYSPLLDDDGSVGGVLDVAVETTDAVVSQRRLTCLADLTAALVAAKHVTDVFRLGALVLQRWRRDVTAVDLYLRSDGTLSLMASNRRPGHRGVDPELLSEVATSGTAVVLGHGGPTRPADHLITSIGGGFDGAEGVVVFALNPQRPFDGSYRTFLDLMSQVIDTALDSAYRRSVEVGEYRRLSDSLKHALLQPASDFATVAARYLPADGSLAIGGDWYDVIDLGDDRRGIVVGDCVGHGLDAATAMAQLRSATRAMLLDGQDPAEALTALDQFAATIASARCATVLCVVVDRRRSRITYARAGHPPALVASGATVSWLADGGGPPLGVIDDVVRVNAVHDVPPDSILVAYSDGLIERPGEVLDEGFARLADATIRLLDAPTVQDLADGLLNLLLSGDLRDDVVLVVKHLPPTSQAYVLDQ